MKESVRYMIGHLAYFCVWDALQRIRMNILSEMKA